MKLLTIGNSFADNATRYLEAMAAAGGMELILGRMNPGGCSLEKHVNLYEQSRLLPDVKPYSFYRTGRGTRPAALHEALMSEKWDFVTVQQVSDLSFRPESYFPHTARLRDIINELAPGARVVIHQTWAYRSDAEELGRYGITQAEMFDKLRAAYDAASRQLDCPVIPSGEAFRQARTVFGYRHDESYDYGNPRPLTLPDQSGSLIAGYYWATGDTPSGKAELHIDGRHGNEKGCYLAGAVWYERLLGGSIVNNSYEPRGVDAHALSILRQTAHDAVGNRGGAL